jgi:hypothetical protein
MNGWGKHAGRELEHVLTGNSGFKIQLKAMYIDASLNSVSTIVANLYQSFREAAVRCLEYVRVLSKVRTTCSSLLISTSKSLPQNVRWWPNASMQLQSWPVRNGHSCNPGLIKRAHG